MAGEMQRCAEGLLHYKHLVLKKTTHQTTKYSVLHGMGLGKTIIFLDDYNLNHQDLCEEKPSQ